jgi:hypothetical protein
LVGGLTGDKDLDPNQMLAENAGRRWNVGNRYPCGMVDPLGIVIK